MQYAIDAFFITCGIAAGLGASCALAIFTFAMCSMFIAFVKALARRNVREPMKHEELDS